MGTNYLKSDHHKLENKLENKDKYERYLDKESKEGEDKRRSTTFYRKKTCRFCSDSDFILDYKDARMMQSFITEHGKIVPRRISGNCALHQRRLTTAVKRARNLALVGYVSMGV